MSSDFRTVRRETIPTFDVDDLEKKYRLAQKLAQDKNAVTLPITYQNAHDLHAPTGDEAKYKSRTYEDKADVIHKSASPLLTYKPISIYHILDSGSKLGVAELQARQKRPLDHDLPWSSAKQRHLDSDEHNVTLHVQHRMHDKFALQSPQNLMAKSYNTNYGSIANTNRSSVGLDASIEKPEVTVKKSPKSEIGRVGKKARQEILTNEMSTYCSSSLGKQTAEQTFRKDTSTLLLPDSSTNWPKPRNIMKLKSPERAPSKVDSAHEQETQRLELLHSWVSGTMNNIRPRQQQLSGQKHTFNDKMADAYNGQLVPSFDDSTGASLSSSATLHHHTNNELSHGSDPLRSEARAAIDSPLIVPAVYIANKDDTGVKSLDKASLPLDVRGSAVLQSETSQPEQSLGFQTNREVFLDDARQGQDFPSIGREEPNSGTPTPSQRSMSHDIGDQIRSARLEVPHNSVQGIPRQEHDHPLPQSLPENAPIHEAHIMSPRCNATPENLGYETTISPKEASLFESRRKISEEKEQSYYGAQGNDQKFPGLGPSMLGSARIWETISSSTDRLPLKQDNSPCDGSNNSGTSNSNNNVIKRSIQAVENEVKEDLSHSIAKAKRDLENFKAKPGSIFVSTDNGKAKHDDHCEHERRKKRKAVYEYSHPNGKIDAPEKPSSQLLTRKHMHRYQGGCTAPPVKAQLDSILTRIKRRYPHLGWDALVPIWFRKTGKKVAGSTLRDRWRRISNSEGLQVEPFQEYSSEDQQAMVEKVMKSVQSEIINTSATDDDSTGKESSYSEAEIAGDAMHSQGRASTGGKTIDIEYVTAIYDNFDQETKDLLEEERLAPGEFMSASSPDPITDEDTCHYAYFVQRKHLDLSTGEQDIDKVPWTICSEEYDNLVEASSKASRIFEAAREYPWISFQYDKDEGRPRWFGQTEYSIVNVEVQRRTRTFHDGIIPKSTKGFMNSRKGYMVKYRLSLSINSQVKPEDSQMQSSDSQSASCIRKEVQNDPGKNAENGKLNTAASEPEIDRAKEPAGSHGEIGTMDKSEDLNTKSSSCDLGEILEDCTSAVEAKVLSAKTAVNTDKARTKQPSLENESPHLAHMTQERCDIDEKHVPNDQDSVPKHHGETSSKSFEKGVTQLLSNNCFAMLGHANQEASIVFEQLRRLHFGNSKSRTRESVREEEKTMREKLEELELEQQGFYAIAEGSEKKKNTSCALGPKDEDKWIQLEVWVEESKWIGPRN